MKTKTTPWDHEWNPWFSHKDGLAVADEAAWLMPNRWNDKQDHELTLADGMDMKLKPVTVCVTNSDWLDPEVPVEWLARFLHLIHSTPNLVWLLPTRLPGGFLGRMHQVIHSLPEEYDGDDCPEWVYWVQDWFLNNMPPAKVWAGAVVESQEAANQRTSHLLRIPVVGRFLILEPLLGEVDLQLMRSGGELGEGEPWLDCLRGYAFDSYGDGTNTESVQWVVVGGESGRGARPCNVDWIRSLVGQCKLAGVPVFVKQLGARPFEEEFAHTKECWNEQCALAGGPEDCAGSVERENWTLTHAKGGDPAEWPIDLRVREFPEGLR